MHEDVAGHAAEQQAIKSIEAAGSGDDQVGAVLLCGGKDLASPVRPDAHPGG